MSAWKLHISGENNRVLHYRCGLIVGQRVRLKQNIVIKNHKGLPTGEVHPSGEEWIVLPGITSDSALWFLQANGERSTWDDDASEVEKWFTLVQ